jgi:hypothetical protein
MLVTTQTPIIRHFESADVQRILNRDGGQVPPQTILEQAACGPAWTAVLDGQPLGCGGLVLPWPGVGIAWMVLSEEIHQHPLWLTRTVKQFLVDMTRIHHLHRVEAVALEESETNQAWLKRLGFTREEHGRATAYLSDQRTMIRYERVKEYD